MAENMTGAVWSDTDQDQLCREVFWKIDLCNCGQSNSWEIVKFLLELSKDRVNGFYAAAECVSQEWIEFGAKVLDSWNLLEHGVGIGCASLTESGELLLRFLNEFGTDDDNWPDWIKE